MGDLGVVSQGPVPTSPNPSGLGVVTQPAAPACVPPLPTPVAVQCDPEPQGVEVLAPPLELPQPATIPVEKVCNPCPGFGGVSDEGAAPSGPAYILVSASASLPGARVLTQGTNITITDNGPGGTLVISASGGGGTLDSAYDGGGVGAGRSITVDSGPVDLVGSGAPATVGLLSLSGSQSIASAAAATWNAILVDTDATITGVDNVLTATGFNMVTLKAPTLTNASILVVRAATFYVEGAPVAAGGMNLPQPLALWVDSGESRFDGTVFIGGDANVPFVESGYALYVRQRDLTNEAPFPAFYLIGPGGSTTGITASSEYNLAWFSGNTVQWATGPLTMERLVRFSGQNLGFAGSSTVTYACMVGIDSPPGAGNTNTVFTSSYALGLGTGTTVSMGNTNANMTFGLLRAGTGESAPFEFDVQGTTTVTGVGLATVRIDSVSLIGSNVVTFSKVTSLYVEGTPTAGGSATATTSLAMWIAASGTGKWNTYFGATPSLGGGVGVIGIANAGTNPGSNPTGGGILYANGGAGTWRGSGGTITPFGPAGPHCGKCGMDFWSVAASNPRWKAWCYECGYCGAVYKGGPQEVFKHLDAQQRKEIITPDMGWDRISKVLGIAA
jgi:hypothetical protein